MSLMILKDGKLHSTPLGLALAFQWRVLGHGQHPKVRAAVIKEIYFAIAAKLTAEEHTLRVRLIPGYDLSVLPEHHASAASPEEVS